jgi:hypothetical protein
LDLVRLSYQTGMTTLSAGKTWVLMTIYDRVFGKRYRQVIRNWEETLRVSGTNETRYVTIMSSWFVLKFTRFPVPYSVNWTGAALTTFYAAVRKALVVVLVLRAIGLLCSVTFTVWWMLRQ